MSLKLNSHQLRQSNSKEAGKLQKNINRNPIVFVLDNVLDTYNIGSFFRLADAIAAQKICLCGPVVTPPNIKIHRASIGTWKWVEWERFDNTAECVQKLKQEGYQIVAIEQTNKSIDYSKAKYKFPIALIAGSESKGIDPDIINLVDQSVEIPMFGVNISLNVLIATSIIAYNSIEKIQK